MSTNPSVGITFGATGQDAVSRAVQELGNQLRQLREEQQATSESALTLGKLFEGFVSYEVINRVAELGKEAFSTAAQIGKLSEITGVSAKTLSVMSSASAKLGVEQEQLGKSLVFLASNIVKLDQGNTGAAKSFGLLGLNAASFNGLNTDQKVLKVVDAIGKMQNGDKKAAAAKALLGRQGALLIPVLNSLAGDGFARAAEEAEKMGLVIDQNTATAALAATVALKGLEETAKGVATQFVGGLTPALADAADEVVKGFGGDGAKSFQTLGQYAGNVLKFLTEGTLNLATVGKAAFTSLWDAGRVVFEGIAGVGTLSFKAVWDAAHGDFGQIRSDWSQFFAEEKNAAAGVVDAWKGVGTKILETDKDLWDPSRIAARQKARLAALNASPSGDDANRPISPPDNKLAKARLDLLRAEAQNELNIWKAMRAAEDAADKDSYDRGLISLSEYFDRRRAAVAQQVAREIAVLEGEYKRVQATPVANDTQKLQRQKELEGIQAQIAVLEVSGQTQQQALDRQEFDQKLALARQLLGYQQQILQAQGKTFDAAMVGIRQEAQEIERSLAQAGLNPEQIAAITQQLQQAKTLAAQFDEERRQGNLVFGDIGLAKGQLDQQVASGQVLRVNYERELSSIYAEELPHLQQIAATMIQIAQASGDPERMQAALQFQQQVQQLGNQADYARQRFVDLKNSGVDAFQSDFSNWIASADRSLTSLGESLSKSFERIFANYFSQNITSKLTSVLHLDPTKGGTASTSGLGINAGKMVSAGATLTASAAAWAPVATMLLQAATTLQGGSAVPGIDGSPVAGGGFGLGGLSSLFGLFGSSNPGAATTGADFSDFAGDFAGSSNPGAATTGADFSDFAGDFAGGGSVRGPGTATSDSIPARLSTGEFVTRAAAVSHYGVGLFHSLNSLRLARGGLVGPLRFAAGGFVPPAPFSMLPRVAAGMTAAAERPQGSTVQEHTHRWELPPEIVNLRFGDVMDRYLSSQWARK